jgi:hypothetical protein
VAAVDAWLLEQAAATRAALGEAPEDDAVTTATPAARTRAMR